MGSRSPRPALGYRPLPAFLPVPSLRMWKVTSSSPGRCTNRVNLERVKERLPFYSSHSIRQSISPNSISFPLNHVHAVHSPMTNPGATPGELFSAQAFGKRFSCFSLTSPPNSTTDSRENDMWKSRRHRLAARTSTKEKCREQLRPPCSAKTLTTVAGPGLQSRRGGIAL